MKIIHVVANMSIFLFIRQISFLSMKLSLTAFVAEFYEFDTVIAYLTTAKALMTLYFNRVIKYSTIYLNSNCKTNRYIKSDRSDEIEFASNSKKINVSSSILARRAT